MPDDVSRSGRPDADFVAARGLVLEALRDSAVPSLNDAGVGENLNDPGHDYRFADLEADSLVLTEICLFIEAKTGLGLSTGELRALGSVNALARHLANRLRGLGG